MEKGLTDVEIVTRQTSHGHFFVDDAQPQSLAATILVMFVFIALHVIASLRAPSVFNYKDEPFPLAHGETNSSVDVSVSLSLLLSAHRFIDVNCRLVRQRPSPRVISLPVDVAIRSIFLRNFTMAAAFNVPTVTVDLVFRQGDKESRGFPVLHRDVLDYDSVDVKMTVASDFEGIEGFAFRWAFANPAADGYFRVSLLIMSLLVLYMLIVYFSFLTIDSELFTETFCVILGSAGVLASNPIALILPATAQARLSDHVLLAAYLGIFRLFGLIQLELLRGQKSAPSVCLFAALMAFFGIYAAVDAAASLDRAQLCADAETDITVVLPTEGFRVICHMLYIGMTGFWIVATIVQSGDYARKRLFAVLLFVFAGFIATGFSQIYCVLANALDFSLVPGLVNAIVHMTSGAFALFLLRSGKAPGYKQMAEVGQGGAIMAEQMSSGDDGEIGFPEEPAEKKAEAA